MSNLLVCKIDLLNQVEIFQKKLEFSQEITLDYYEPGLMENLEQYKGVYDEQSKQIIIRCDVKGLRYDNRTSNLERVSVGDAVQIVRDEGNAFNSNNFSVNSKDGASLGHLPAELCNALGPLYDAGCAEITAASISYIEKIGQRSRYAKQGVLFVEIVVRLKGI